MAHLLKCFLFKKKNQSSDPEQLPEKPSVIPQTCNPSVVGEQWQNEHSRA